MANKKNVKNLTIQEALYKRLEEEVYDNAVSIRTVAEKSGVPQPSLSRWLTGERPSISAASMDKLAEYFNMTLVSQ